MGPISWKSLFPGLSILPWVFVTSCFISWVISLQQRRSKSSESSRDQAKPLWAKSGKTWDMILLILAKNTLFLDIYWLQSRTEGGLSQACRPTGLGQAARQVEFVALCSGGFYYYNPVSWCLIFSQFFPQCNCTSKVSSSPFPRIHNGSDVSKIRHWAIVKKGALLINNSAMGQQIPPAIVSTK